MISCSREQLVMECWFNTQSIKKRIVNMLKILKLRFFRLSVVVKKQFVLKILKFLVRNANSMLRVIFPPVTCLPLPYLSHYFKYGTVSEKYQTNVFLDFLNFSYFRRNWWNILINASMSFIKYLNVLRDFEGTWFSSTDFWEIFKY